MACSRTASTSNPKYIIPEKKMAQILSETYLIESKLHFLSDSLDKPFIANKLYQELFKKHEIDSAAFVRSLNYYIMNKELSDSVFEAATNLLIMKESGIQSKTP